MEKISCYILFPFILALAGCSKEDPKPDADYTGTLVMEYSRPLFSEFIASANINISIYKSGNIVLSGQAQYPFSIEDSLTGGNSIKINEIGTITISGLSGRWIVDANAEYLSVSANTLIEGTQKVWLRDNQESDWELTDDNTFRIEDPVSNPLNFKISEAIQENGSVLGIYETSDYGTIIYQWTLRIDPV